MCKKYLSKKHTKNIKDNSYNNKIKLMLSDSQQFNVQFLI